MDNGDFRARLADTLAAHIEEIEREQALLEHERYRYSAMLGILRDETTEQTPEPEPEPNGEERLRVAVPNVSQERVQKVIDAIRMAERPLAAKDVIALTGIPQPQTNTIIRALAEAGALRDAGRSETKARLWSLAE